MHEDYASAHLNKGIVHNTLGETLEAIQSFTKSLDLNPNDDRVRYLLGGALLSHAKSLLNSNYVEAEECLHRAMTHVDDSIENIDATNPRALHLRCEKNRQCLSFATFLVKVLVAYSYSSLRRWMVA